MFIFYRTCSSINNSVVLYITHLLVSRDYVFVFCVAKKEFGSSIFSNRLWAQRCEDLTVRECSWITEVGKWQSSQSLHVASEKRMEIDCSHEDTGKEVTLPFSNFS